MASILSANAQNTCMICLGALMDPVRSPCDYDDDSNSSCHEPENDIGSVFPCGHCFHVTCFQQWSLEQEDSPRCPNCNQDASLFCKLYLSAPSVGPPTVEEEEETKPMEEVSVETSQDKEDEDNDDDNNSVNKEEEEEKEQRRLLLDLRNATQAGPAQAIRKVVSLRSKLRKLKREGRLTRDELESTKLVLQFTQEELQLAQEESERYESKANALNEKLNRIQTLHWQRHEILHEELERNHRKEVQSLEKELARVKMELAMRNRQLQHWAGVAVDSTRNATPARPAGMVHHQPAFQHA